MRVMAVRYREWANDSSVAVQAEQYRQLADATEKSARELERTIHP
jgi:hypothetical protein